MRDVIKIDIQLCQKRTMCLRFRHAHMEVFYLCWNHISCSGKNIILKKKLLSAFHIDPSSFRLQLDFNMCNIFIDIDRWTQNRRRSMKRNNKKMNIFFNTQVVKYNAKKNPRHLPHYKCLYCLFKLLWIHSSILRCVSALFSSKDFISIAYNITIRIICR